MLTGPLSDVKARIYCEKYRSKLLGYSAPYSPETNRAIKLGEFMETIYTRIFYPQYIVCVVKPSVGEVPSSFPMYIPVRCLPNLDVCMFISPPEGGPPELCSSYARRVINEQCTV